MRVVDTHSVMLTLDEIMPVLARSFYFAKIQLEESGEEISLRDAPEEIQAVLHEKVSLRILFEMLKKSMNDIVDDKELMQNTYKVMENCLHRIDTEAAFGSVIKMFTEREYEDADCGFMLTAQTLVHKIEGFQKDTTQVCHAPLAHLSMFHYDENGQPINDGYVFEGKVMSTISSPLANKTAVSIGYSILGAAMTPENEK